MRTLRLSLLASSAVAAVLFATGFVVSFVRPLIVERLVRDAIRHEVQQRVAEQIERLDPFVLSKLASRSSAANAERIARLRRELPKRVAAVVAEMQDADCECRRFVASATRAILTSELLVGMAANDRLTRLIRRRYAEVSRALMREFRIFTGANALVFLLLFGITRARSRATLQLLLPAVVLFGAAVIVASLYLFGQDWLHTIVFSDYVGLTYFAYLGTAVAFLSDIVFNRARVSTRVVNTAFHLVGATISAVPC